MENKKKGEKNNKKFFPRSAEFLPTGQDSTFPELSLQNCAQNRPLPFSARQS